jgi:hypothetical protein
MSSWMYFFSACEVFEEGEVMLDESLDVVEADELSGSSPDSVTIAVELDVPFVFEVVSSGHATTN